MSERRLWTREEDEIILQLVARHGPKKWTEIAQDMKTHYAHLARSSKQIRERYGWDYSVDGTIILIRTSIGMPGLKRRRRSFLMLIKNWAASGNKLPSFWWPGFKNSTNQMRVLKPSILCKLIEDGQNSEQFRALIDGIFQFAKFKPNKATKTDEGCIIGSQKILIKQAIQKLTEFNSKYERNQNIGKSTRVSKKSKRKSVPKTQISQTSTAELELNSQKDLEQQNNWTHHETMKQQGQNEIREDESSLSDKEKQNQFENGWEESNQNQFLIEFPEFEKPDQEHYFLPLECKEEQFFP